MQIRELSCPEGRAVSWGEGVGTERGKLPEEQGVRVGYARDEQRGLRSG